MHRLPDSVADFDNDGGLEVRDDIDLLYGEVFGRTNPPNDYDLTNDDVVDQLDVDLLVLVMLGTFYGDADLNGTVDIGELNAVRNQFGATGVGWAVGDFDGNETVDIDSLNTVRNHFGARSAAATAGGPIGAAALETALLTEYAGR